jgi:hypothetical protein
LNEIESRRTKLKIGKEIPIFIKTAPFCIFLKKKKKKRQEPGDASPGTVHCLPRRAARVADFQACLLPRLAPKSDKACTDMSTWNPFILGSGPVGSKRFGTAPFVCPNRAPRAVCKFGSSRCTF